MCPDSTILAHTLTTDKLLEAMAASPRGLDHAEAARRLEQYGSNALPQTKPPGPLRVFLHQFTSPLIYILLAAAVISIAIGEWSDAIFILAVLLINAAIGTSQEYSAERAANALNRLVASRSRVLREGDIYEIDTETLVPGDLVLLESGDRIPADLRLISCHDFETNESLLTGESLPVRKMADVKFDEDTSLADRRNMVFAGTLVNRGRGRGIVVTTGLETELGHIAADVLSQRPAKTPLLIRMETFTRKVGLLVGAAVVLMAVVALGRGQPLQEIFLLAVALAVSVIPEGLPVALTVALAIGMRRMAKRNVIVRQLVAVEALGSCTLIATDKTGTLTENQLTAKLIATPSGDHWDISGGGITPEGSVITQRGALNPKEQTLLGRMCQAAILPNDGFLGHRDHGWAHHGDAVDVALLVMAHKAGINLLEAENTHPERGVIPFESGRMFAASLNETGQQTHAYIKGALERLLPMCTHMAGPGNDEPVDASRLEQMARALAEKGYRVLALASGPITLNPDEVFSEEHLHGLTLLALIGMIDPLRPETKPALTACKRAGIHVAMVTGDHPATASAIANELKLIKSPEQLVTGAMIHQAADDNALDSLTHNATVFARVEPEQKVAIVNSLQRQGHFVAVCGDGANDAPALRTSQVGVAMGKHGTDVARETAELIITDDNFASIVSGIEEGRIAYANVRKVVFLLISTGAAELVLFTLSLLTNLPLPLLAVQLLWLNLVTNGIQDVALAFEAGEGHEMRRPPRPPKEAIFNRLMIERVVVSALVIGVVAFVLFQWLLNQGFSLDEARNGTLLLMVLFENIHVFNCRSETRSAFAHNPLNNPFLLISVIVAQSIHIGAMYIPFIGDVLHVQPVNPQQWLQLLGIAFIILLVMELHKAMHYWLEKKARA